MNNKSKFSPESRPFGFTFERRWVTDGIDAAGVTYCKELSQYLYKTITITQLRNIFNEIKRIELKGYANEQVNFQLLRPKVAYAVARIKPSEKLQYFLKMFEEAHSVVHDEKTFKNLANLFEALIAYYTVHEKQNSKQR